MGLIKEFKEFAVKGNAMNLAVGVIIGAAFGKIVSSIVEDILMPVLGKFTGGLDFSNMYLSLAKPVSDELAKNPNLSLVEAKKFGAVLAYGNFITISINFLIVAFCVFILIKGLNSLTRKEDAKAAAAPATPPPPPAEQVLLTEIRDILKSK